MKTLSILLVVSFSASVFASSSPFRGDSQIPAALKEEILMAIESECPAISSANEISTSVVEKRIDQGQVDLYFTTTFKAVRRSLPDVETVTVQSVRYDLSNPAVKSTEVLSVDCL
ncbi:MAG: hypothetical protein KF681_08960 [Bdellovibrionaceae bacterium]|nr:hypothetical protein [Pseudobdellovibrionaceae bacterium]